MHPISRPITLIFLVAITASAAGDPLAFNGSGETSGQSGDVFNGSGEMGELERLLAGEDLGFANRSELEDLYNLSDPSPPFSTTQQFSTPQPSPYSPPFSWFRNETLFADFLNLTAPEPAPLYPAPADLGWNETFFGEMFETWWET